MNKNVNTQSERDNLGHPPDRHVVVRALHTKRDGTPVPGGAAIVVSFTVIYIYIFLYMKF